MSTSTQPRRRLGRSPKPEDGPRARFSQLLPYLAEHRPILGVVIVLSILGAGASLAQPLLVSQVITVVQAGDPDWRAYYTVNLLNLPHHYHHGGVWPFIGGLWVRFINQLGFNDVACQELLRTTNLARLD